jgi:hypothetical protein
MRKETYNFEFEFKRPAEIRRVILRKKPQLRSQSRDRRIRRKNNNQSHNFSENNPGQNKLT